MNLPTLLAETAFAAALGRSVSTAIAAGATALLLGLLVAYALPRSYVDNNRSSGSGLSVLLMLGVMILLLPASLIVQRTNILSQSVAVLIIYALAVVPFCIWRLKCSLNQIPPELEDAARIDGCSAGQVLRHVVLPVIAPSLVITALFSLLAAWTFWVVLPLLLQILAQKSMVNSSAAFIAAAPVVILFLFLSLYLLRDGRTNAQVGAS